MDMILVCASVGFVLAGLIAAAWNSLDEYELWRRSCGRSNFWPMIR